MEVLDFGTDLLEKATTIGICMNVCKVEDEKRGLGRNTLAEIARTFEILWLDTQIKSAHVQFEDGHFDAFINEYVIKVYTQEELMNGTYTNRS